MSCHASPAGLIPNSLILGGSGDAGTVSNAQIVAGLVGVTSAEDPKMNLVTAGDPTNSFLMHKVDGDQCVAEADCNAGQLALAYPNCGANMPLNIPPATLAQTMLLPVTERDKIRAWIKQGANP